jgi:hypothetical protein
MEQSMGLNAIVGILAEAAPSERNAFRSQFKRLNSFLKAAGLPPHDEPLRVARPLPLSYEMFGYSGIHYLRRLAAHVSVGKKLTPNPKGRDPTKDPVLKAYNSDCDWTVGRTGTRFFRSRSLRARRFDHLLFHSDAGGFYLPRSLRGVLLMWSPGDVYTNAVGSAQMLLVECEALADAIGLPLGLDPEGDELWEASDSPGKKGWKRFGLEAFVCLRLYRLAHFSMQSGAAVVFA